MATNTTNSLEKPEQDFVERADSGPKISSTNDPESHEVDAAFAKRTLRRVDLKLLPILAVLYSISLIDRVNISNAYVAGMAVDLELTVGARYSIATLMFFVPYIIFELPANILVRKVGARIWIGTITLTWAIITLGMGFLKHWWELVICRALLGIMEAGFFPAATYIISSWYIRREIQKRMTGFYVLSVLVGGFSSALAGGISELAGQRGLNGWQWIFIFYGAITGVAALGAFVWVQDFPDKNDFLTPEQTKFILTRIDRDRADAEYDHWTMAKFWSYCLDWRLWSYAVLFGCGTTVTYAFAYFLPIILSQGMGYSTRDAQLLTAPPYAFTAIFAFFFAWLGDKYRLRAPVIIFQALFAIVGLALVAFATGNAARYVGVFIGIAGASANIPGVLGYQQNNIAGLTKRAFGSALTIGGGGIGGIVASTVFRSQDAPGYRPGLWVCIGANLLIVVLCVILSVHAWIMNKKAKNGTIKKPIEGREGFLYTY